ncbi:DUF4245 family protein [Streptomyces sp. DW26H14]|uniref:DUF4245 family protein n=1 Tax=Streptomyces sp. DW26H14 TaxID=3435395 RepID=UPI00403DBBF6
MAGDEQQGATTAETAAPAGVPTAETAAPAGAPTAETAAPAAAPTAGQSAGQDERAGAEPDSSTPGPGNAAPAGGAAGAPESNADGASGRTAAGASAGGAAGGGSRQRNRTVRGMVLSLLVIGAAVAVIYTFFIPHDDKASPVKRVDYRVELITARRAASYPVAAPVGLPKTWKATSVTYDQGDGEAWHIGFLDPAGQYVAIEQSTSHTKGYVSDVSQNAKNTGRTHDIAGKRWQRWNGGHYNALVHSEGDSTTVVTGTASDQDLAKMAAALEFEKTKA